MTLLWAKSEGASLDDEIRRFTAAEDLAVDRVLFPYDVRATAAHVRGLVRIGILSERDGAALVATLDALETGFAAGRFVVDDRFEDGHSAIEHALVERLGDLGRRVHTGRSRNDQVQVAIRLYTKDRLSALGDALERGADVLLERAHATRDTVMPGYTHLQRAVPSTVGLWLAGLAESLIDDLELTRNTQTWVDANPLGTGAGFGVNLPLDREGVTRELGFARVAWNPMAVQNARGKMELVVLTAFEAALLDVRRFAWDLSLFTMQELGFVRLPDAYTTGSSLMPNKRNPDVAELVRAAYGVLGGARVEIASTLSLPSGYQRDLQRTKAAYVRAIEGALPALAMTVRMASDFEIDAEAMRRAIDAPMFATDHAIALAQGGVPFREAYRRAAATNEATSIATPEDSVRARISPGACADLRLDEMRRRLDNMKRSP